MVFLKIINCMALVIGYIVLFAILAFSVSIIISHLFFRKTVDYTPVSEDEDDEELENFDLDDDLD